jgi:uncharacterized protein YdaU (DUF1376 family)
MKLWTQRFFGSVRVQGLPGRHRLIYLGLLVAEWGLQGAGLPNDLDELARVLGIPKEDIVEAWGAGIGMRSGVSQFFELREGRLFNETCEELYRTEVEVVRKKASGGKLGNKKRWGRQRSVSDRTPIASRDGGCDDASDGEEGANGDASAEYLAMLEGWGGLHEEQRAKAEGLILRTPPAAADVAAWRRCFALASTREDLDAMAYCRSRALCESHPSRAGIPWWNAAERERKARERKVAPSVPLAEIAPPPRDLGEQLKAMRRDATA